MGKSMIARLKNDSGQNPIEAAKLNCKVYHGPFVSNFKEIYDILKINKISYEVTSVYDLTNKLINDLKDPRKKIENKSNNIQTLGEKILSKTMKNINNFLDAKNI